MGIPSEMEHNWPEKAQSSFQIPSILIEGVNGEQSQGDWVDWSSVAKRIQGCNYNLLKNHFENNPEFLISNLLLHSFRFFPDFDRTREDIRKFEDRRTIELNEKFQDINQHAIITDSFIANLNKNVGFNKNDVIESLAPIKYSIVIENIEARRMEGFSNIKYMNNQFYDLVNDNVSMVVCINHGKNKNLGYCNVISTINLKERSYSVQTFQSSHTNDEEVDISIDTEEEAENIQLNDCFKQLSSHSLPNSSWGDLEDLDNEWFLSPKIFRNEYISKCLTAVLSQMDKHYFKTFTQKYGVIHCSKITQGSVQCLETYSPVINVPYDLQDELRAWEQRASKVIEVSQTSHTYKWPTRRDMDFAMTMSFNLTPSPRKEMRHLEWMIDVTELFNRLFKSLSRNQVRAYLFAIAIYKNYEDELKPLKDVHFKHIVFDFVEKNPAGPLWFDENLGKTVFHIFETLKKYLRLKKFPHYFMPQWNLLGHFPPNVINSIYSRVHQITEDYLGAVIQTMSKLEYVSEEQYYTKINLSNIEKFKINKASSKKRLISRNLVVKNGAEASSTRVKRLTAVLNEFIVYYLNIAVQSYKLKDMGLYSSYIYTLDNLVQLVDEYDLGIYMPEIHGIKKEIKFIKTKYSPGNSFDLWYHNLSNENNLINE